MTSDKTLLRSAASLGDARARNALGPPQNWPPNSAFDQLMTGCEVGYCADNFDDNGRWEYPLEAAIRMALAVYRDFLPDWDQAFRNRRNEVPDCVPVDFARKITLIVAGWILDLSRFSWDEHARLYGWIKDDICRDGYLRVDFPNMPRIVSCYCYSALYLIDVQNCHPDLGPMRKEFNPKGIYPARTADVIGWFVDADFDIDRMRQAVHRELIPWCLGESDPLLSF